MPTSFAKFLKSEQSKLLDKELHDNWHGMLNADPQNSLNGIMRAIRERSLVAGHAAIAAKCVGPFDSLEAANNTVAECIALLEDSNETAADAMLTVAQAAERFNLSKRTVYRLLKDGLPHSKARGAIRIKATALQDYLAQQAELSADSDWETELD